MYDNFIYNYSNINCIWSSICISIFKCQKNCNQIKYSNNFQYLKGVTCLMLLLSLQLIRSPTESQQFYTCSYVVCGFMIFWIRATHGGCRSSINYPSFFIFFIFQDSLFPLISLVFGLFFMLVWMICCLKDFLGYLFMFYQIWWVTIETRELFTIERSWFSEISDELKRRHCGCRARERERERERERGRFKPARSSFIMENVRSPSNKMDELEALTRTNLDFHQCSLMFFTETCLQEQI